MIIIKNEDFEKDETLTLVFKTGEVLNNFDFKISNDKLEFIKDKFSKIYYTGINTNQLICVFEKHNQVGVCLFDDFEKEIVKRERKDINYKIKDISNLESNKHNRIFKNDAYRLYEIIYHLTNIEHLNNSDILNEVYKSCSELIIDYNKSIKNQFKQEKDAIHDIINSVEYVEDIDFNGLDMAEENKIHDYLLKAIHSQVKSNNIDKEIEIAWNKIDFRCEDYRWLSSLLHTYDLYKNNTLTYERRNNMITELNDYFNKK